MELTRSAVEDAAAEYRRQEPLYAVEREQIELLPGAFEAGEYGWRDAEWVVRWYYRRHLGAYPDRRRREREARFDDNDFEAVRAAIGDAVAASDAAAGIERLTALSGVDVPVASAFLLYVDPGSYLVVGEREWGLLREAGELADPYPDPPTVGEYGTYLDACRALADRFECDLWTLYRAIWRLGER